VQVQARGYSGPFLLEIHAAVLARAAEKGFGT
jgi:hypothetical protein